MLVFKNNLLYFTKLKSVWVTTLVFFILTIICDAFLSVFISWHATSKIIFFWFVFSLILVQIITLNIQLFNIIFFEHKKIGIFDLEIRKGIKKQYVFIYRLLASFIITLSVYFINIVFYYAIVLPTLILSPNAISLFAYGILTIILFDIVFKTFMTFLTILKKAAMGISLGSIIGVLSLLNPVITKEVAAPVSLKMANDDYQGPSDFNNFYIASELFNIANKQEYEDGILNAYIKQFTNLPPDPNSYGQSGMRISQGLYKQKKSIDSSSSVSSVIAAMYYLNSMLGLDTETITELVKQEAFAGIEYNPSQNNTSPTTYEYYIDEDFVKNFYENTLNPVESESDFSDFWKAVFNDNSKFSISYVYENLNKALKTVENKINYENKQEWIEIEPILKSYFFNSVYKNGTITYDQNFVVAFLKGGSDFIDGLYTEVNEEVIGKVLKNVNPFICQIRAMLYNIFSWVYSSPLYYLSDNLLDNFNIADTNNIVKQEYITNWASEFNKNSKKYYLNPFVVYSSVIYNQGSNFLDNAFSNSIDSVSYTDNSNYFNPYGPISISLDDNGQVSNLSIGHNLYYINSLVWIVPIIISAGFLVLTGYIFTKKLIS